MRSAFPRRLAAILVGCFVWLASAGAASANEGPPVFFNAGISPSSLPYTGGDVAIFGGVNDDTGIDSMYAEVTGTDGFYQAVTMAPCIDSQTWCGNASLPSNFTFEPVSYSISVIATDTEGLSSEPFFAGEAQVAAQPQFDEAPVAYDPVVSPRELAAAGGDVSISAKASDDRAISEVYAVVTLPSGATQQVPLEPTSFTDYSGTFAAPANTGQSVATYSVEVTALDDIGQPGIVDAGTFTVAAAPKPAGRLQVLPGTLRFGSVKVGRSRSHLFVLRNSGPRGSAPISGTLKASGDPFTVAATSFQLRPGQVKFVWVRFKPTKRGQQRGSVAIKRADGAQPGLALGLVGSGH